MEEPITWRHGGPEKSRPSRNMPRRQEKRTTPDPPRTPREQCGRKRARSDTEEREKLKGSHPACQSPQRRGAHSGEGQKHSGHQLAHGSGSLYRSSHRESKSPGDGRSSGDPPCKRKRSQSRGRAFPAEPGRWEKCSSSTSCYCCHATGDGGGKEFWHWAKDLEKLRLVRERLVCSSVDQQVSGSVGNTLLSDMRQFTPSLQALAKQMKNKAPGRENVSVQSGLTAQPKRNGERQKQEVMRR